MDRQLRARERGKFQQPLFSWRATGFILLMMASVAIDQYSALQSVSWHRQHHALTEISFVLVFCALALLWYGFRYTRRLRRLADSQPADPLIEST